MTDALPRYEPGIRDGQETWTPEEIAMLLDHVLTAESKPQFAGACDVVASKCARGKAAQKQGRNAGDVVHRFIWGLAVRYTKFPHEEVSRVTRVVRDGLPLSYAETEIIRMGMCCSTADVARNRKRNGTGKPTAAYFAQLFHRTDLELLSKAMTTYGPAKGRGDFGLLTG